jgi:hypothetical protein
MAFVVTQRLVVVQDGTEQVYEPLYLSSYDRNTHAATWGANRADALVFNQRQEAQQPLNWFWIMNYDIDRHHITHHRYELEEV